MIQWFFVLSIFAIHSICGIEKNDINAFLQACCEYSEGNYSQVENLLSNSHETLLYHPISLFLLASSYENLGKDDEAIDLFQKYLNSNDATYRAEAHLKLVKLLYHQEKYSCAEEYLEQSLLEAKNDEVRYLCQFYLAKLFLKKQLHTQSEHLLLSLIGQLPFYHLLGFESHYLLGEIYVKNGEIQKAAYHFEKALPTRNHEKADWYGETLYHLGCCYSTIANDPTLTFAEKMDLFAKGETSFETLQTIRKEEKDLLAFAQLMLHKGKQLNETSSMLKVDDLLNHQDLIKSQAGITQALLLCGQAATSYSSRNEYFRQAIEESEQHSQEHIQAWYLKGVNDLEYGKSLHDAIAAFKKVADLSQDPSIIVDAMTQQIQAYLQYNTEEANSEASIMLKSLLSQANDGEQVHYLLGSLHFLEADYIQAEETFLKLADTFPGAPLASAALFFASQSASKQKKEELFIKAPLQKILEKYPHSPYAAESYIRLFSPQEYLAGSLDALQHLQAFPEKYPHSPFVIYSYYLMGLDAKRNQRSQKNNAFYGKKEICNYLQAIEFFQNAAESFDRLEKEAPIPKEKRNFFLAIRNHSLIERAWTNLDIAQGSKGAKKQIFLEYAKDIFQQMIKDFVTVRVEEKYSPLCEESEYGLIQCFVKNDQDHEAEPLLDKMLEKYQSATITRGYYLSRVWYEKGAIAMRQNNYSQALKYFVLSEDSAKGKILSIDQKLDLWIQQSFCHRALGQLDLSMRLLSQVINEDAVSQLRLQAMLLRAEVYEEQGRKELAQRQLEALTKKGGPWAIKAKGKLDNEYGF